MSTVHIISIVAIVALLFFSAFFSGSETALTAASKARIRRLAREGRRQAKRAGELIEDKESLIGSILLGNNLVNILASALATSVLIALFGQEGVAIATVVMTTLVLIFAEVLPKTYAITNPVRVALRVAGAVTFFVRLFSPVVAVVQKIVSGTLKAFGIDTSQVTHVLSGEEEIRGAIELEAEEGRIYKAHRYMLGSILDLSQLTVEDIMIHRKNMVSLDAALPPAELVNKVVESTYTRIPLWENHPENIIGVLSTKDVLRALAGAGGDAAKIEVKSVMVEPWFVPETTLLSEQLRAFLDRKSHFALVVDEYGALMGLVTLEDIIEEIVGDIQDEYDPAFKGIRRLKRGEVLADGAMTIRDLNREMDWNLPDEQAATVAGFVIHLAEMIPFVGQTFTYKAYTFEVVQRRKNQITKVRIRRRKKKKR